MYAFSFQESPESSPRQVRNRQYSPRSASPRGSPRGSPRSPPPQPDEDEREYPPPRPKSRTGDEDEEDTAPEYPDDFDMADLSDDQRQAMMELHNMKLDLAYTSKSNTICIVTYCMLVFCVFCQ